MNLTALGLVIIAAFTHAFWNFLCKKSSTGPLFVWCYTFFSIVLYLPIAIWLITQGHMPSTQMAWLIIAASSLLHLGYSVFLQRGYHVADLTVVYPVARGTGPLLSATGAYLLLGEVATPLSIAGLFIIVGGIGIIAKLDQILINRHHTALKGVQYGGIIGLFIASYTLVDAHGVKALLIHPLLLDYIASVGRLAMLSPNAWKNRRHVRRMMRKKWIYALGVGLTCPIGYILVLSAMKFSPISLIAPAREMSMMIAALLGTFLLKEGDSKRRMLGAACIILGVMCLVSTKR